ncbi:MAG: sugar ABC transporter ATP-binding protein [Bauldia sp.]|nr:sugar ABC transporter ATP-binding protein [Bauldia sp.]
MAPLLDVAGVAKRFGAVTALSDGALRVGTGEIHALLGANGSGKSTLCKIIAGAVARDAGVLQLHGADAVLEHPRDAERLGVGLFYQELSLVPQLTVADNIFLGHERTAPLGFLSARRKRADVTALISRFAPVLGDGFSPDVPVARLAADQRQIVEILKVLSRKPKLIIFDEATAALDRRQVAIFFDVLRELRAEGVSSIFISHRMDEIFAVSDRITVMRNGVTVASFATADTDQDAVVHAMVGDAPLRKRIEHPRPANAATARITLTSGTSRRLHGVSLSVGAGEILGLGGLQGQGQSVLLQGLFGAAPFTNGTIAIDGKPVSVRSPAAAVRHGVAYVSGDRGRDAALQGRSIFENIANATLVREKRRVFWPRQLKPRFEEALKQLNTKYASLDAPIGSLSGGNQQKVFIARWLATGAKVLLLDDPAKGVDLGAKADFFSLARGLAAEGAGIVFYASDDAELLSVCDRILVFNSGRITAELTGSTLTSFHLTKAAYGEAA